MPAEDPDGEEQRLQALLAAFAGIKKGFPGHALERAVQARPTLLAEADASVVQVPPRLNPETSPAPSRTSVPARSCVRGRCWPVVIAVCVHFMLPVST